MLENGHLGDRLQPVIIDGSRPGNHVAQAAHQQLKFIMRQHLLLRLCVLPSYLIIEDFINGSLLREDGEEGLIVVACADCQRLQFVDFGLCYGLLRIHNDLCQIKDLLEVHLCEWTVKAL